MSATLAFIASMKLEALRGQRDVLDGEYRAILAAAEAAPSPAARLRALHDGLGELRLAGELVHPDLPDLTAVLETLEHAPAAEIDEWTRRLGAELERGRARSEAVYTFGGLLEEAAPADQASAGAVDGSGLADYLDALGREPGPEPAALAPGGLLDRLFDGAGFARVVPAVEQAFEHGFGTYATGVGDERKLGVELPMILSQLAGDPEWAPGLRAEARRFSDEMSESHVALRDALEISLADPSGWRWPDRAIEMRPVLTADRVRFRPDLELVPLLVLEQLALWLDRVVPALRTGHVNRRQRLDRLIELDAPEIIIANERRLLEGDLGVLNDPRVLDDATHTTSIAARRDLLLTGLWDSGRRAGGHYGGYTGDSTSLVRLLGAELAIHRATERPLYAVRADVADCFASIDHRVILGMVDRLGIPADYRALIGRYLAVPLPGGRRAHRGVLLGLSLSRLLADLVLGAVELEVRRAGVSTARMVDDFVLWSDNAADIERGYAALVGALDALGLAIQPAKTGAVAAGGELPAGLPAAPMRFNLLTLEPGGFAVDEAVFAEMVAETRAAMDAAPSLLAAVRAYNGQARFVAEALVPHPDLPGASGDHMRACAVAVQRFAGGVETWLHERIAARFDLARPLPRAWLYWPVSAGGLGLRDAMLELGAIPGGRRELPAEPFDELAGGEWGRWYGRQTEPAEPRAPRESAVSQAQLDDFIARGGELRGSAQDGLGTYWKWVLAVHGPEILERFGTFRFLLRKLVPLDILSSR